MDEHIKQLLLLGREHYEKRELGKAEPMLRQVLEQDDRLADVHDMLGVICHSRGNFAQAEYHFERALAINPNYTEAALNLAVTYNDRGKYEAARQVYSRIKGTPGGNLQGLDPFARGKIANMHARTADAYQGVGMNEEAAREYRKALDLCPTFVDIRTKLASTLRDMGDKEAAVNEYLLVKQSAPKYIPARINLGVTLYSLGRKSEAKQEWEAVLVEDPSNRSCRMYLDILAKG